VIERSLVDAAARMRRQGEPYVIATVVRARRPGARLLLTPFRWIAGGVSGGAFEGELATSAWMHTKDAGPVVLTYDAAHPDIGNDGDLRAAFGLADNTTVDVMIERAGTPGRIDVLEIAARCARSQQRASIATVIRSDVASVRVGSRLALSNGALEQDGPFEAELREAIVAELHQTTGTTTRTFGAIDVLFEAIAPPPRLFVFGTGHDLVPLAQLAKQAGWDVLVCAETPRYSTRERFVMADDVIIGTAADLAPMIDEADRAVCVVATHDGARDRACVAALRGTTTRAIGVVGRHLAEDDRIHELVGETALERAFHAISLLRSDSPVCTPAIERPVPSRPSAVFAAVAAL
jgi:xanthine/CO dehydrogenase XdhC/CoxF family maturation factor